MKPERFTLKTLAGELSLKGWGVIAAKLTQNTGGVTGDSMDTLILEQNRRETVTPDFPIGTKAELFGEDGVRRFLGWSRTPIPIIAVADRKHVTTFEGPERFLKSAYRKRWNTQNSDGSWGYFYSPLITLNTEAGRTGGDRPVAVRLNLKQEMQAILDYGKLFGDSDGPAAFDYDLTGVPEQEITEDKRTAPHCDEAMEALMKWMPGVSRHWDFTTNLAGDPAVAGDKPVLRFVCMTTIDDAGAVVSPPTLSGAPYATTHTLPLDGTIIKAFEPKLSGLLIRKLRLNFLSLSLAERDGRDQTVISPNSVESVIENWSIRTHDVVLPARSALYDGTDYVSPESIPSGFLRLARLLHMGCDREWWSLDFTSQGSGLHWEWHLGNLMNVSGSAAAHAVAYAIIQSIERDLYKGSVSVKTGTPRHRGASELTMLRPDRTGGDAGSDTQDSTQGQTFGMEKPNRLPPEPGTPGTPGTPGLPAIWHGATLTDDGGDPFANTVLFNATTNSWDLVLKNLVALFASTVDMGTTAGDSNGSISLVSGRKWKLSLNLNIPGITSVTAEATTLTAGSDATASVTFIDGVLAFTFGIPRGATGAPGTNGTNGTNGEVSNADMNAAIAALRTDLMGYIGGGADGHCT